MRSLLAMADQWPVLNHLLDEAPTLPADQRAAWLAQLVGADTGHREALEALLATQAGVETAGSLARLPVLEPSEAADDLVAGAEVGAYRPSGHVGRDDAGLPAAQACVSHAAACRR
ncbi:hypothetical protein ACG04R_20750 [Roseateles sp. BYS78W]|uniref:Uncharacterized protein n=1 Tax=Pelomonas candidula TaxID=3299025 RepID=A0ABW7HGT8_9BURK